VRWRFVDRIVEIEPWAAIRCLKAVSFEEYSLLKRHGREGVFPESLMLECCVESVRWLAAVSSRFELTSALLEVSDFRFHREVGMGETLRISAGVKRYEGEELRAECCVRRAGRENPEGLKQPDEVVATGTIVAALSRLDDGFERETVEGIWREIHGAS